MTIKDIAEKSGYSIATVSRVLNNSSDVSRKAYVEVMEVVEKYNFVPNSNAKQLKQQNSSHIAIIVKGSSNMLFSGILEKIQKQFKESSYATSVYYIDEDANEIEQALQLLREQKPKAVLFLGGNVDFFRRDFKLVTVPSILVTTSGSNLNFENLSSVYTDDVSGGACAVDYLIKQGHHRIGIIGGNPKSSHISQLRYLGCIQSFANYGISFDAQSQFQATRFSFHDSYDGMKALYERCPDLTAVFAMSDVMAIGAIRALVDVGKRVPEDVSVIGYDGIELARFYNPKIATIKQMQSQIAKRSVAILLQQLDENSPSVHETIPFRLIPGESVINII